MRQDKIWKFWVMNVIFFYNLSRFKHTRQKQLKKIWDVEILINDWPKKFRFSTNSNIIHKNCLKIDEIGWFYRMKKDEIYTLRELKENLYIYLRFNFFFRISLDRNIYINNICPDLMSILQLPNIGSEKKIKRNEKKKSTPPKQSQRPTPATLRRHLSKNREQYTQNRTHKPTSSLWLNTQEKNPFNLSL